MLNFLPNSEIQPNKMFLLALTCKACENRQQGWLYKQSEVILQLLPVYKEFMFSLILIHQNSTSYSYQCFLSYCDFLNVIHRI